MSSVLRLVVMLGAAAALPAVEVTLAAPASTIVPVTEPLPAGGIIVRAELTIPADAPADLGVGAWAGDRHGTWAGRPAGRLSPGRHTVAITLAADSPADGPGGWGPWAAADADKGGLFFYGTNGRQAASWGNGLRTRPNRGA